MRGVFGVSPRRAARACGLSGGLQVGAAHAGAVAAMDARPQRAPGRQLPSNGTLHGAGCRHGARRRSDTGPRCLEGIDAVGLEAAFGRYQANRKPRASDVQNLSNENTFLRRPGGTDWVYGYDVWTAPLDAPGPTRSAA